MRHNVTFFYYYMNLDENKNNNIQLFTGYVLSMLIARDKYKTTKSYDC